MVGDDLGELVLDVLGVDGLAADDGEGLGREVELAFLDVVSGGFGCGGLGPAGKGDGVGYSRSRYKPTPRMMAQRNWTAMGIRYDPVSLRFCVEKTTQFASRMPSVMQN